MRCTHYTYLTAHHIGYGKSQHGLTLIELLITVAITASLVAVTAPSIRDILTKNSITADLNELSAIIQFARHHAIDEQVDTVVCPSTNFSTCTFDWTNNAIVFADENNNRTRDADERLLVSSDSVLQTTTVSGPDAAILFKASGAVSTPATILLCPKSKEDQYARAIIVSLQGRVRLSRDMDGNGRHQDNAGNQLTCTAV